MKIAGLDFKNLVGIEIFNCFKRVCIFERNTTKCSRSDPVPKEVQNTGVKKMTKSMHKVLSKKMKVMAVKMKLRSMLCQDQLHNLSPLDRWEKIEKGRMCFSCLKPRSICKTRNCNNVASVSEILKCTFCASWVVSKRLAPFSIFFCKQKQHGDSRAPLADLKK